MLQTPHHSGTEPAAPQIQTGNSAPVHACAACHQVWPEPMMRRVGERWLCALCKERALGEEANRYQMRLGNPGLFWLKVAAVVVIGGGIAFRFWINSFRFGPPAPAPAVHTVAAEPWAKKPAGEWPALSASITESGKDTIFSTGGTLLLVRGAKGKVVGTGVFSISAKDAKDAATRDGAEFSPANFKSAVPEWNVTSGGRKFTLTLPDEIDVKAYAEGLVLLQPGEKDGWPLEPLTLRTTSYSKGAKFSVVSCGADGKQIVRSAHVTAIESNDDAEIVTTLTIGSRKSVSRTGDGSATQLLLDASVLPEEIQGAAVVDSDGHLAAIVTGPTMQAAVGQKTKSFRAYGMLALNRTIAPPPPSKSLSKSPRLQAAKIDEAP